MALEIANTLNIHNATVVTGIRYIYTYIHAILEDTQIFKGL